MAHRHKISKPNNIVRLWHSNIDHGSKYNWHIVFTYVEKKLSGNTNSKNIYVEGW